MIIIFEQNPKKRSIQKDLLSFGEDGRRDEPSPCIHSNATVFFSGAICQERALCSINYLLKCLGYKWPYSWIESKCSWIATNHDIDTKEEFLTWWGELRKEERALTLAPTSIILLYPKSILPCCVLALHLPPLISINLLSSQPLLAPTSNPSFCLLGKKKQRASNPLWTEKMPTMP